jgi:hypothetical protein
MASSSPFPFTHGLPLRIVLTALSLILYLTACIAPALVFHHKDNPSTVQLMSGLDCLVTGWLGVLIGQFAWFANPMLWLSMVAFFLRRLFIALFLVALSLFMATNTFLLYTQEVPADEGGVNILIFQSPHLGFFLWVGSMLLISLGAWWLVMQERRRNY